MDKELLKYHIHKNRENCVALASALGISAQSLYGKINETRTEFKQSEIKFIQDRYHLNASEIQKIFFD